MRSRAAARLTPCPRDAEDADRRDEHARQVVAERESRCQSERERARAPPKRTLRRRQPEHDGDEQVVEREDFRLGRDAQRHRTGGETQSNNASMSFCEA